MNQQLPLLDVEADPGPRRCPSSAVVGWHVRDGVWVYACEGHRSPTSERMERDGTGFSTFVMFPRARCGWAEVE